MQSETKTVRSRRTRAALVAAVHDRLARKGGFTADEIAQEAGCTAATFWSHFGTKDDAITAAFSTALDDLVALTATLFGDGPEGLRSVGPRGRQAWAAGAVDRLLRYFGARALLFRAAVARIPEHRELRRVFRAAEKQTIEIVAEGLGPRRPMEDAVVVISFCQGLNNSLVLKSKPGDRVRRRLAGALVGLVFGS